MAYNKNRNVYRNSRVLEERKKQEQDELINKNKNLINKINIDMKARLDTERSNGKMAYIDDIVDYIESNNISYADIATLKSKKINNNINQKDWDRTIGKLDTVYKNIKKTYENQVAVNELNNRIKTVFDDNVSRVSDNIRRIKFSDPVQQAGPKGYNLADGIETIRRFGRDFVDIMSPNASKQTANELTKKAIENVDKIMILTSNGLGKTNQSIYSIKEAFDNLNRTGNLVVFDLETFGGKDIKTGSNMFDRITEFSFLKVNTKTGTRTNEVALMGIERSTVMDYVSKIEKAMKDGTFVQNSDLGVTASRLARYGQAELEFKDGIATVAKFPGDDFDSNLNTNLDAIKRGAEKLAKAYEYADQNRDARTGLTKDVKMLIDNAKNLQDIFMSGNGVVAGYNHTVYDIPFLNSRLQKYYNSGDKAIVDYMDSVFKGNISLNPTTLGGPGSINKTLLDMRSAVETATKAYGMEAVYGKDKDMILKVGSTPNRQEFIGEAYQRGMFAANEAHKAEFDTEVLASLLLDEIDNKELRSNMNIPDNYKGSALDYILNHIGKDGYEKNGGVLKDAEKFEFNPAKNNNLYFMINNRDRAANGSAIYRGEGHLDFTYDVNTKDFHFANLAKEDIDGNVNKSDYYSSMQKDLVYQVSGIKKIDPSKEFLEEINKTNPEYASGQLYALEFKAVTNNPDSPLATQRHVKIFKTFDEMEGFLSSQMDIVAEKDSNGVLNLKNGSREKLNLSDNPALKNATDSRTDLEVFNEYVDGINDKINKDKSRRYFFDQDKTYKRIRNMLAFADEIEKDADLKNMSIFELNNRLSEAVVNATNNKPIQSISKNLHDKLIKTVGYTDMTTKERKMYRVTGHNAINALEFIRENRGLLDTVMGAVDEVTRTSDGKNFLAGHNERTASYILKNVLNDIATENPGTGKDNVYTTRQIQKTFDIRINGIYNRKNTRTVSNGIGAESDIISISDIFSQNAKYTLRDKMMNAHFSKKDLKRMTSAEKENARKAMVELFVKNAEYQWQDDLDEVSKMLESDDFNSLDAFDKIVSAMRRRKQEDANNGIIKLKQNDGFENLNANQVDNLLIQKKLKNDPDYIKNIVDRYKNISYVDTNDLEYVARNEVKNLIGFDSSDIESKVKSVYGNINKGSIGYKELQAKNILFKNAQTDLTNMIEDLFASAQQAGADIEFNSKTGSYSLRQGDKLVDILLPKLKMTQNGMMYIKYGNQNIKLRHKVLVNDNGQVSLGTSINDIYTVNKSNNKIIYKNRNRVKRAMEEGTFELNQISDLFKRDLKSLAEDAKMVNIRGGDYYSNMSIDAKDFISKVVYATFSDDVGENEFKELRHFRSVIENSELYDEKFVENFKMKFGKKLNPDSIPPDALLYMARESPLMLEMLLKESSRNLQNSDFQIIADSLNIGSKKQETEKGIYALGEQRQNVIASDSWNNHARPVSGGSGNFYYTKKNSDPINIQGSDAPTIRKGALVTSQNYNAINNIVENGEEYTSVARMRTLYAGDIGFDAIIKYQFDDVIKSNTVSGSQAQKEAVTRQFADMYAQIRSNLSVFEQQKIMDPLAFEKAYGSNIAADEKFFSKGLDLIGGLLDEDNEIDDEAIKLRERLINVLPTVEVDSNGKIVFSSGKGEFVTRDDKVFEHKGFGGINEFTNSRLRAGVLNFGVKSNEGIDITDDYISKILNQHADEFVNAKSADEMTAIALNIIEREGYSARFSVKDINKISLPKINSGSGEKSMTSLIYAKTGSVDKDIRDVFTKIQNELDNGMVGLVDNTILHEDAVLAILDRYEREGTIGLDTLLANFSGKNVEEKKQSLLKRIAKEQMSYRDILFNHGKLKGISAISNDAIEKHGNIGMMFENNLSNAISLLSKYMDSNRVGTEQSYNQALDFVVNAINYTDSNGNNPYAIFKNENIKGLDGKDLSVTQKALKVTNTDGSLMIDGLRSTDENHMIIDGKAFGNLIRKIDQEISNQVAKSGIDRDEDDHLVVNKFHKINLETGQVELVDDEHLGQGLFIEKDGKKVMAGTVVEDAMTRVFDPETQTDIDYRYLDAKRGIVQKQTRQHEIIEELNELRKDPKNNKSKIRQKEQELRNNKLEIKNLKEEAATYNVKPMRYSHTDERLLLSHKFNDAMVNRINTANMEAGKDIIEEYGSKELKELLTKDSKTGKYILDIKDKDISTSVFEEFTDRMRSIRTRKEGERLLTEDDLKKDEYKHLRGVYENVRRRGGELGVESAQDLYDLNIANKALLYNGVGIDKSDNMSISEMQDNGFTLKHIDDVPTIELKTDTKAVNNAIDEHLLIDLGSTFSEDQRYIALPGLGKFVGDSDEAEAVRREYQKKFNVLKSKYDVLSQIPNTPGAQKEINGKMISFEEAQRDVINAAREVKEALNQNIFGKTGAITMNAVIEMPSVSMRQKITGTGFILDDESKAFDNMIDNAGALNKRFESKSAMSKAMINGKSLIEWEKSGVYFDYAFASEDVFRSMGFLDQDKLKKLGLTESEMIKKLETEGVDTLAVRYPEIYDSSMINTKLFLDRTVGNNTTRVAEHTMLKYNGDVDGDSMSYLMLESKNGMNSIIYNDIKSKNLSKQDLVKYLESNGYDYKDDYLMFQKAQVKAEADALTKNKDWRQKAREVRRKDYDKNIKSTANTISSDVYRNKITNVISDKKLAHVDSMVDNMLNDAMAIMDDIEANNPDAFKDKFENMNKLRKEIAEEYGNKGAGKGKKISVKDMKNPTKLMNESLDIIKQYGNLNEESKFTKGRTLGELVSDTGNYSISSNVRKMYNEAFIEQNNKTGAAAIGSVNVKLVPIKAASRNVFTDTSAESEVKDSVIQEIAAKIEQNAINSKKQETTGNQSAVPDINDALREFMNRDSDLGKGMLEDWFDNVSGDDAFKDIYDNVIKAYDDEKQSNIEQTIVERANKNGTSKNIEKSRWVRDKFMEGMHELKNNNLAQSYFKNSLGSGRSDRSGLYSIVNLEEGVASDTLNDIVGIDTYNQLGDIRREQARKAARIEANENYMKGITASSSERPVSSLVKEGGGTVKKLLGHRSSGLAMGVIGLASGLLISGFASGNPLQQDESPYLSDNNHQEPQSIPEFFDEQGGFAQQSNNGGYIINVRADTKQGKKALEKTMKKVAKQGFGNVSVNMSVRDKNKPKSNQDIQNWIASNL